MMTSFRLCSVVMVLAFTAQENTVFGHGAYNVRAIKNSVLFGHSFLNLTAKAMHMDQCLATCLQNCRCMSFQLCPDNVCQLCSSNKDSHASDFKPAKGCMHFLFTIKCEEVSSQQDAGKSIVTSCCATSNPCQNGGTCEPSLPHERTRRFRCHCAPGYLGELCENKVKKSCRGFANGNRVSGVYIVHDANMQPFTVHCDFDPNSQMAWTLIQSYQQQYNSILFKNTPFSLDNPVNEDKPFWPQYRLSKARMLSIQQDSTKFRMTCNFDTDGLQLVDYARASTAAINILSYDGHGCAEFEYVDIRGYNCSDCTTYIEQTSTKAFHMNAYKSKSQCTLSPLSSSYCSGDGENNFGYYDCKNTAHRCTAIMTSTSQTWFGGE